MKKLIIICMFGLLAQQTTRAQGTLTYLSNLEQPSAGSLAVGSDSWYGALFWTGNNASGYVLNTVQLGMADATGNPSGFTVMLYSLLFGAILPGNSLGTLNGSANPSTTGIYTYTPTSNLTLSPSTDYFIVLTAGTTVANGAYEWNYMSTLSYNPSGNWNGGGSVFSSNGSHWTGIGGTFPEFAITATAIPEPSPSWLLLLGSGIFIYVRARNHFSTRAKSN